MFYPVISGNRHYATRGGVPHDGNRIGRIASKGLWIIRSDARVPFRLN